MRLVALVLVSLALGQEPASQVSLVVLEELAVGAEVADLGALVGSTDVTLLESSAFFQVDGGTGKLVMRSRLDREALCEGGAACTMTLVLMVQQAHIVNVALTIADVNDNAPSWTSQTKSRLGSHFPEINVSVSEHSELGTKLVLPTAHDPDALPDNATITYQIKRQSVDNAFRLVSPSRPELAVGADLDRDAVALHEVLLEASDSGKPEPLRGHLMVKVLIVDINNHAPQLHRKSDQVQLAEKMYMDKVIYQAAASDADSSDQGKLRFSFSPAIASATARLFRIDAKSGRISVSGDVDFEQQQVHRLPISVTDGKWSDQGELIVTVTNVNDNYPVMSLKALVDATPRELETGRSLTLPMRLRVAENGPSEQMIASLIVTDRDDLDADQAPTCMASSDFVNIRRMNLQKKHLFSVHLAQAPLDREARRVHEVRLECRDRSGAPGRTNSAHLDLEVHVTDENDSPPKFLDSQLQVNLSERALVGSPVTRLTAHDPDEENTSAGRRGLRYAIVGPATWKLRPDAEASLPKQPWFQLDPVTGELRTLVEFDSEILQSVTLPIQVRDGGGGGGDDDEVIERHHVTNASLLIEIADENDCEPTFSQPSYTFRLWENVSSPMKIGMVQASDCDVTEPNNRLSYWTHEYDEAGGDRQLTAKRLFQWIKVDQDGSLHLRPSPHVYVSKQGGPLDREKLEHFRLFVKVRDGGSPPKTSSALVEIHVMDVNDNTPQWKFPSPHIYYRANLSYDTEPGERIIQVQAEDPDQEENGQLVYSLLSGNQEQHFGLEENSGWIYLHKKLNATDHGNGPTGLRTQEMFNLLLQVSDKGEPPRKNSARLQVRVTSSIDGGAEPWSRHPGRPAEFMPYPNTSRQRRNGALSTSDLLIIIAMVVAALAALLLIIAMVAIFRCKRMLPRGPHQPRPNVYSTGGADSLTTTTVTRRSFPGHEGTQKFKNCTITDGRMGTRPFMNPCMPYYKGDNSTTKTTDSSTGRSAGLWMQRTTETSTPNFGAAGRATTGRTAQTADYGTLLRPMFQNQLSMRQFGSMTQLRKAGAVAVAATTDDSSSSNPSSSSPSINRKSYDVIRPLSAAKTLGAKEQMALLSALQSGRTTAMHNTPRSQQNSESNRRVVQEMMLETFADRHYTPLQDVQMDQRQPPLHDLELFPANMLSKQVVLSSSKSSKQPASFV